jgi:uncharacterized damage-inducible protein DinB
MIVDHLVSHWKHMRDGLLSTIDKFSDAELAFVPFAGSYSVRETMLHIAHAEAIEMGYGLTGQLDEFPPAYQAADYPTKEVIKLLLGQVHLGTRQYLGSLDDEDLDQVIEAPWGEAYRQIDMLLHVMEHEAHHRGELSLVLGLLGREGLDA